MAKKMGRPKIEIDKKKFENACALQCALDEIACLFDCSEDTIERWCKQTYGKTFAEVFKQKRGAGKMSLRRHQFQLAKTSASMAIWLGKQYLGQKDNKDITVKQSISEDAIKEVEAFLDGATEDNTEDT